MGYEQNITIFAVIGVTLVILWYVDKEIKILRNDVNNMKDGLSLNIQMFQKLKSAYQSIPVALGNRPPLPKQNTPTVPEEETCKVPSKLETIKEVSEVETVPKEPLPSNEIPVLQEEQKEQNTQPKTTTKKGRRKIETTVV